jgi:glycosyltransferase involved in cell wall biosynthesis
LIDKSRQATFSVVMPAHNAGSTIERAIESVLRQTRQDFELIIVDDGSTDETAARVQPYLRDGRVMMIHQQQTGPAGARNTAIAAARGRYVSFLDSDDVWLPVYLEFMGDALDVRADIAVCYTDAWVFDNDVRRIARETAMGPWHPRSTPELPREFLRALLEFGNFVFVGATIRRSTLATVGAFRADLDASEDYELWLRVAAKGFRFVRCARPLVIYRRKAGQITADAERMQTAANAVFEIVAREYDICDELRALALRKLPLHRFPPRRSRRIPGILRRPYRMLSRARHFYMRPPADLRGVFSDLRSI